ncbi:SRPBCC domain-containing protein [bacterium]|nr:SRPBCC domain-containing protein [bacterium]
MKTNAATLLLAVLLLLPFACLAQEEEAQPQVPAEIEVTYGELETAQMLRIETRLWIDAPVDEVWQKAILDIDGWWPHSYKPDSRILFEPWAGGRVYEQFRGGDTGAIFGHVLYIEDGRIVKLDGQWGMPRANVSGGVWKFEELDGGTLITTNGAAIGELEEIGEGRVEGTREVWLSLKRFIEDGERVDRSAGRED